jgi:hypothetical protein
MEITSNIRRRPCMAAAILVVTLAAAVASSPTPAASQHLPAPPPRAQPILSPKLEEAALTAATTADGMKDCVITDKNGRKWPCSRALPSQGATLTTFTCNIEDRMGNDNYSMFFFCDDSNIEWWVDDGVTEDRIYDSVFDPAPKRRDRWGNVVARTDSPRVTCEWRYAGNIMSGMVVWDEQWPEAWSCRQGGDGPCKLVFENKVVTLVTARGGRRVLGDVAVKECGKNWGGLADWLPFGIGCDLPQARPPLHRHHNILRSW